MIPLVARRPARKLSETRPELETPLERMEIAFDLFDLAEDMIRTRVLRENPSATEQDLEHAVDAWMRHRPGAENGDAPGQPISWPQDG